MPAALIAPTVPRRRIPQPDLRTYIPSLLACLPGASVSPSPPTALLPLLSPILRQRVQLLSAADNSPWLPLLCYDTAKAGKLEKAVQGDGFELHPVSSEIEIDWADGVKVGYRRRDEETLNAVVDLLDLNVRVILLFCVGDVEGGGDGWRIGEVSVIDGEENSEREINAASILQAESMFSARRGSAVSMPGRRSPRTASIVHLAPPANTNGQGTQGSSWQMAGNAPTETDEEEEEDDGYWDRYDQTPARTPAPGASPAPGNQSRVPSMAARAGARQASVDEDAYYAQYAEVQPAMDGHDPDEAKEQEELSALTDEGCGSYGAMPRVDVNEFVEPAIFQHGNGNGASTFTETTSNYIELNRTPSPHSKMQGDFSCSSSLQQPRPSSSNSSDGSITVERLERTAAAQGQSEIGIKQHVSTSVKSLYRLARAAGIDRAEFERLVRTELDVLSLMELEDDVC